jgi:tetratricopeptide (TPR) repeat protein
LSKDNKTSIILFKNKNNYTLKARYLISIFLLLVLLDSCTSTKNTAGTRWYHSINTRYNVYFNGNLAYREAMKTMQDNYTENYTETILMFPVSALPKEKTGTGGSFDKAIEKSVKSIKTHSIQTKPEAQPGKRNNPKYQEFMNRIEYNPFLHNAWMMMAQSQFYNGDFLQAASSFSYIARLYATQPKIADNAKIWKARSYGEIAWYFEAEEILSKIDEEQLTKNQRDWLATVKADLFIKQKQYQEAIPYLQVAIKSEKNKLQKNRERYLLGQVYEKTGQRELAYKAFGDVNGSSVPYILEFSAKIRQTEVYSGKDTTKAIKKLRKMTKSSKNKDYLDQIYYALGNIYMTAPDTLNAIVAYEKGVEESTQNGLDKALNQIQLGDIYFQQKQYIPAQPNYSEALGQLKKEHEAYPRVSKRSEVLDELVVFYEAVQLQDSLLRLSKMTEEEQLAIVNKIIEDLIKKEEEERKKAEREDFLAQREENREQNTTSRPTPTVVAPTADGSFYFYNPQVVAVGKNSFQQKWGRRKLEDNWRRRNKSNPMSDFDTENDLANAGEPEGMDEAITDTIQNVENKPAGQSSDPKDPQFYLQQIPKTEEDVEASHLIVADGLFNMGLIYKDKLEDFDLAIGTFDELDTRYPENENKLEAYYHTYLIYLRKGDMETANLYKQKIRETFPESEYAIAMADPNYEYNIRMMDIVQDSIYRGAYDAYLNGNVPEIRSNYQVVASKYTQSKLMPKFMFLNALSYVQTNDPDMFKEQLKELINKYPEADVSVLASEMMKGFQRGLLLSSSGDGMLARGSLFNTRFGINPDDTTAVDSLLAFLPEVAEPHKLLLIYPVGAIDDNLLLYTVAGFNFGNFRVNDFDLEKTTVGEINMLHIKGFNNLDEVLQYVRMIDQPEGYVRELGKNVVILPISSENYEVLMKGKSLEEYMQFFEENYGKENQALIEKWKLAQEEEMEVIPESEEIEDDLIPEPEEETGKTEEIEMPVDSLMQDSLSIPVPEIIPLTTDSISKKINDAADEVEDKVDEIYNQASDGMDKINDAVDKVANDPIRAFLNLFKKKESNNAIDEYAKEQEKAEKERQKQLKKEKTEKEKAEREIAKKQEEEQKVIQKQEEEEQNALLKEKKRQEEELKKTKEAEEKAKIDARKQKQEEQKAEQKRKAELQKAKEKQREEERKLKEKERKAEQKRKAEEREAARKQKEAEKKAKNKK